jgi:hypothetical protein
MEKNPWSKNLRKTGFIEKLISQEQNTIDNLNQRQEDLKEIASNNNLKKVEYQEIQERKSSLSVEATYTIKGMEKMEEEKRLQKIGKK